LKVTRSVGRRKRLLAFAFLALASLTARAEAPPVLAARAWLLLDASSNARLAAHAPTLRLEPASLTKLMTAYVVFTAIGEKRFGLDDAVKISNTAFAAPGRDGARMFVEPDKPATVGELLQGMLTVSGNDAATALAEQTSGNVEAFVKRMNDEARRLGMTDTRFSNPTGLSDSQQYSTANDLARLAQRLMADFPQYKSFFNRRELTYNRITQLNRNRLLWSDPSVDGMKTGQLATVGWSIIATASRTRGAGNASYERRMIAVVLGAPSDALRTQDALRLLNYGYTEFETLRLYRRGEVLSRPEVWTGTRADVPIGPENDVFVTLTAADFRNMGASALNSSIERPDPLVAPLLQGEMVGRLKITLSGRPIADVPMIALERVEAAGILRRAYDAVRLWWRRT